MSFFNDIVKGFIGLFDSTPTKNEILSAKKFDSEKADAYIKSLSKKEMLEEITSLYRMLEDLRVKKPSNIKKQILANIELLAKRLSISFGYNSKISSKRRKANHNKKPTPNGHKKQR